MMKIKRTGWLIVFFLSVCWAPAASTALAEVSAVTVIINGMSCPFCAFGVEKKLKDVAGVEAVDVDMGEGTATLSTGETGSIDVTGVPDAVARAGFTPGEIRLSAVGTVLPVEAGGWSFRVRGSGQAFRLVGVPPGLEGHLRGAAEQGQVVEVWGIYQAADDGPPQLIPDAVETVDS